MITKEKLEEIISVSTKTDYWKDILEYEKNAPYDYDIFSYKFAYYMQISDYTSAYEIASEAININPFSIDANYNYAVILYLFEKFADAYLYFARTKLFQERANITIVDNNLLDDSLNAIEEIVSTTSSAADKLAEIKLLHKMSQRDPFKQYQEIIGTVLTCYNGQKYYVGHYDNFSETYFGCNPHYDTINTKAELFEFSRYNNYYTIESDTNVLLPVCMNPIKTNDIVCAITTYDNSDCTYVSPAKLNYSYFPSAPGQTYLSSEPVVFAKPIPLKASPSSCCSKKLILNIFIDSFNYKAIRGKQLEKLMPNTYNFFKDGTICTNYYSTSEWTMPSIATYWTGKRQTKHMNLNENYRMDFMKSSKVLAEYFHDAGYVTAKIGGNDSVTPFQGYNRGIDRFVYQYSSQGYKTKNVVVDALQHIETFKSTNQFVWLDFVDLHDIAGNFEQTILSQSKTPIETRMSDNLAETTVKQSHSTNKSQRFNIELSELDFYLNLLYQYITENYKPEEVIVTLFSDHGTSFMVDDEEPFISHQREQVPLLIKGYNRDNLYCDEIIENTDYAGILCSLAGIDYNYSRTDANLPVFFGGTKEREYALSQCLFVGDNYMGALHGKDFHYYLTSGSPIDNEFRFTLDDARDFIIDESTDKKHANRTSTYRNIITNEVRHLIKY